MSTPHESEYQVGSMDISEHQRTYRGFIAMSKYMTAFCILIVAFLAIFRTH